MTAPTVTLEECAVDFEMNCGCGERGCMNCDRCALVRAADEVVKATRNTHPLSPAQEKALAAFDNISKGEVT